VKGDFHAGILWEPGAAMPPATRLTTGVALASMNGSISWGTRFVPDCPRADTDTIS
jgi:hypothetical protein